MARKPLRQGQTGSRSLNKLLGAPVLNAAPLEEVEAVASSGTLTLATNPTAGDAMVIGAVTYGFVASGATGNQINIGGDLAATKVNVRDKLLESTVVTPGSSWSVNNLSITHKVAGVAGNITTTETFTAGGNVFGAATLTGGVDAVVSTVTPAGQLRFHEGSLYYSPDGVELYTVELTPVE